MIKLTCSVFKIAQESNPSLVKPEKVIYLSFLNILKHIFLMLYSDQFWKIYVPFIVV